MKPFVYGRNSTGWQAWGIHSRYPMPGTPRFHRWCIRSAVQGLDAFKLRISHGDTVNKEVPSPQGDAQRLLSNPRVCKESITGKRFRCGDDAEPFDSVKSAESALSKQKKQDEEYCPDCFIKYEVVEKC